MIPAYPMPESQQRLHLSLKQSFGQIDAQAWDACLRDCPDGDDQPFLTHRHLMILEQSGAFTGRDWVPQILTAQDSAGRLVAAVPLFLKHSAFGDFIDETPWVEALERTGRHYYSKMQVTAPFVPISGPRLLIRRDAPAGTAEALIGTLVSTAAATGLSGVHASFLVDRDRHWFQQAGWLSRMDVQFHWHNPGYRDFGDFLAALTTNRRSSIRAECRRVAASGVRTVLLSGADLREEHMAVFSGFYRDTFTKKGSIPHLPPDYFLKLGQEMADRLLLVMARDGDRWIGGTLNYLGNRTLFCRSWGGESGYPFLYFEVTHYRAMEYAIANGLHRIEGGVGGTFKLSRGYQPVRVWSAHRFIAPDMEQAVAAHLQATIPAMDDQIAGWERRNCYRAA